MACCVGAVVCGIVVCGIVVCGIINCGIVMSALCGRVAGGGKVSVVGLGWGSGSSRVAVDRCRTWFRRRVSGVQRAAGAGKLLCISHSSLERLISVEGAGVGDAGI